MQWDSMAYQGGSIVKKEIYIYHPKFTEILRFLFIKRIEKISCFLSFMFVAKNNFYQATVILLSYCYIDLSIVRSHCNLLS